MATLHLCRAALRRNAVPLSLGLTSGLILLNRQQPMRLDAIPPPSIPINQRQYSGSPSPRKERLDAEVIKQLSGGSLSGTHHSRNFVSLLTTYLTHLKPGFLTGLLVSVFSKTLVLLIGIGIVFIQVRVQTGSVTADNGIDHTPLSGCCTLWHRRGGALEAEETRRILSDPHCLKI